MKNPDERINELPVDLRREVEDFVDFLVEKHARQPKSGELRMDWAGALKEYKDQYTSLELQKEALEWRGD